MGEEKKIDFFVGIFLRCILIGDMLILYNINIFKHGKSCLT